MVLINYPVTPNTRLSKQTLSDILTNVIARIFETYPYIGNVGRRLDLKCFLSNFSYRRKYIYKSIFSFVHKFKADKNYLYQHHARWLQHPGHPLTYPCHEIWGNTPDTRIVDIYQCCVNKPLPAVLVRYTHVIVWHHIWYKYILHFIPG